MKDGGILRGYITDEMMLRFFSYISDDMLYENQKEWQEKMNNEYLRWVNDGVFGSFGVKDI
jgi:hypothetical protein